jgi:hypothetical protein
MSERDDHPRSVVVHANNAITPATQALAKLALPVAGTASLIWAGKKLVETLLDRRKSAEPETQIVEAEPEPAPATLILQQINVYQINVRINIRRRGNPDDSYGQTH